MLPSPVIHDFHVLRDPCARITLFARRKPHRRSNTNATSSPTTAARTAVTIRLALTDSSHRD